MRSLDYLIKFWFFIHHGEIKKAEKLCDINNRKQSYCSRAVNY